MTLTVVAIVEIENAIPKALVRHGAEPCPLKICFAANAAWLAVQVMAYNLARWTARIGLGELLATTKAQAPPIIFSGGRTANISQRPVASRVASAPGL